MPAPSPLRMRRASLGFTLAELLIALMIIAEIATFTIPKVLVTQQNQKYNAMAKEMAGMISGALQSYSAKNTVSTNTSVINLLANTNYVKIQTSGLVDDVPGFASLSCGASTPCYIMHNGMGILVENDNYFCGTSTTDAVYFTVDPDGVYGGSTSGSSKSLELFLYANGKLRTHGTIDTGTRAPNESGAGCGTFNPDTTTDPSWFSWN
ncbi:MAG TPA: type II secretion system protein [Coleofasciculaceae cyanobacterium]